MDKVNRIKELVDKLNTYRDGYYNENSSPVTNAKYDSMFDELELLENETGIVMTNSPTHSVGYEVKSKLEKSRHNHPMLSLGKTKSVDDIIMFLNGSPGVAMLKMDGLTCSISYENGELSTAETRGNGEVGEIVTHNVKVIDNVPTKIPTNNLVIDGEVIITKQDFEKINSRLPDDKKYKNPRNLASGSIRQLDSNLAAQRHMRFIPWKLVSGIGGNSFNENLETLSELGFDVVPMRKIRSGATKEEIINAIYSLKQYAEDNGLPIDGIVFTYEDIAHGESLGLTSHHPRHSIAYKFREDEEETILTNIEWQVGKTGVITPIAIFDTVDLCGTEVGRASVHNISIIEDLQLGVGDTVTVYKANEIIPQIKDNLTRSNTFTIPDKCPCCGEPTEIHKDNDSKTLHCTNPYCKAKLIARLTHFVSRDAMNIDGLSEATLEKIMSVVDIKNFYDIYTLKDHYDEIVTLDGLGEKSVKKLLAEIEHSKDTELSRFLYALSIPMVGKTACKTISKYFNGDFDKMYGEWINDFDWTQLNDFGNTMHDNMTNFIRHNCIWIKELADIMNFKTETGVGAPLANKTYVITGTLYKNSRKELTEKLESLGAKVAGSVSVKTTVLINNDTESNSSKNKKAKELGVPIMSEDEFLESIEKYL